jgi:hypothetical protein
VEELVKEYPIYTYSLDLLLREEEAVLDEKTRDYPHFGVEWIRLTYGALIETYHEKIGEL